MAKAKTHERNRNRLRKQLRARGYSEAAIEQAIARKARDQKAARDAGVPLVDKRARKATQPVKATRSEVRATHRELDRQFEEMQRRSIEQARERQLRVEAEVYGVDDTKHKPSQPDPLKTGVARVTGLTAKAVGRKKALTRWEYEQLEARR